MTSTENAKSVGILRRLGAFFYDFLLILAIWFVGSLPVVIINNGEPVAPGNPLYIGYLLLLCFLFYGWFWTHGGQTLGMRAWKIRLENLDGSNITWWQALHRFSLALFTIGLGILWCLTNKEKQAFYDRLAHTHVIQVDKEFVP
jgi:uncharacterized RDD family membrane protein YckC